MTTMFVVLFVAFLCCGAVNAGNTCTLQTGRTTVATIADANAFQQNCNTVVGSVDIVCTGV